MKKIMLARLQARFIELVNDYLEKHDITQKQLAEIVDIPDSHLSNLLRYKRILSATYLYRFFITKPIQHGGGIFKMEDIYDGKANCQKEKEFWDIAALAENTELLRKIIRAKKHGLDVEAYVDGYLTKINHKSK